MEDQQISPTFGTIVLVGDSRVHHLASSFKSSWPHNSTEIVCKESEETHIDSIINMIEEELSKTYASDILIVVLGFHCDIMMLINHDNESNVQIEILRDLVKKIHSATERWKKLNPVYKFLWCLPSVPDFKRYNKNNKKYIPYKEQDILEIQKVRKYFWYIKELKQIWENIIPLETTVLLDLNMIGLAASSVADPLRTFAKFEDLGKLPTFVASQTIDGLHLTPKMAVSFWNCVSNCASQSFFGLKKIVESTVNEDLESVSNKRKMVRMKQMDFSKKISTKVDLEVISKSQHEEQASSQQDDLDYSLESKNKDDLNILSKIPYEEQILSIEDEVDYSPESHNEEYISPSKDTLEISSNSQNQVQSYCMEDELDYSLEKQKEELVSPSKDPLDTLSKIQNKEQSYCMEDVDYSLEKLKEDWVSPSKGTFKTPSKSQNKVSSIECKLDYSSESLNEEHVYSVDDENLDVPSISLKEEQLKLSLKSQSSLLDKLNLEHELCSSTNINTCTHLEKDKVLPGNFISFKDQKDCSNIAVNDVICLADYSTNKDKIITKLKEENASVSNIVLHNDKSSGVLQEYKKKNSECNSDAEDFFAVDESDDKFFREVCDVVKEIDEGAAKNKTFLPIYVQKNDSNRDDSVKVTEDADAVKKAKKSEKRKISFPAMEEDTKLSASKDALESANKEEMVTYHQEIEKIVKLQDNRIQNNIVIVTDDRDNFDVTLNGFNTTKVTVLKVPGLKMSNAFSYIQAQYLLGKGTIFVFCCGTHDLTLSISLEDCLAACCPSPLTMLTIPYKSVVDQQFLVNTAVKLNMDILVNTENDIAIFCGLIPVRIAQYNDFAANNRKCGIFHPVNDIPHIAFLKWNKYKKTIFTFNTFITDHANKHKFRPWNLDRSYYSIEKTTVLLPNFYNITPEEEIRRANQVKLLCTELLLPRCSNSALINPLNEMTTSQKLQDNVKPEDEIFKSVVLNQLSLYKEEIQNIKIMHEGRVQRFIVIVTDDRDNFQEHFSNYDNRISILKEPRLRLDAAFQLIKMHPKFGKGTIFVFLCGIADLLDYEIAQECLTYTCPYPQGILTLQENDTHCLIKKALKLNKDILQTTMSDVALFSGIVPIDVNYFNTYIANKSKDHSFHQKILLPNTDIVSYVRYREAIAMYSNFIKYHAQDLGFSPWDLEQSYYTEDGGFRVLNQSGYSLCLKELVNRADQAKLLCTEMLLQSCTKSDAKYNVNEQPLIKTAEEESLVPSSQIFMPSLITAPAMGAFLPATIMDPMPPTVNIPFVTTASMYMSSTISAPFVPAGQIISSFPSSAPYVPVSSMYVQHPENTSLYSKSPVSMGKDSVYSNPSLALGSASVYSNLCVASKSDPLYPNTDSPLPLSQIALAPKNLIQSKSERQINQTYDQVAIIADCQYASFIQQFAERPEVVVLADFKLKVDYLEDVIKAKKDYLSKRTLYLLVFGVHSVTKIGSVAACQQKRCSNPLQVIEPLTHDMIDRFIDTEIKTLNNVVSQAKLYLPAESNIEILPPLPVSLISLNIGHENLHRSKSHFPGYLIAKRIDILEKIFPLWMKKISVLANSGSSLIKCCKVFPTTANKLFYIQDLQVMNCVTEEIPGYNQWKEVIKNIVSVSLDLHLMEEKQTSLEISTNDAKSTDIAPLTSVSLPINRHLTITTDKIIIEESVVPGVKKGLDNSTEFAKTILNMKKDICHSSAWFKNAFIVSNHQISWMTNSKNPFAKSCFESKFIYHALINYDEGNIKTLLRKMGSDLHSRSLCCFMFDLSIFGIEQNTSARSKYLCPLQHIVNTVEPNPNVNPKLKIELELFIENELLAIEKFIQQLGKIVPVVILPIVPARIYCDNGDSSNYQNHKAIKKTGAYIVQGSDQVWKFALEAIVSSWNHFMEKNNREIDNYNYITTYTENNLDTFTVGNDLNDFKSQWTQPDIWMAFIETFIASLVDHMKSFRGVSSTKRMSEKTYIAIKHISPWIPFPFMMELFTSLDDKAVFELNNDRYKLRNVKLSMVLGLMKKLNSFRFGASKIKAVLVGDDRVLDRVDSDMMLTFYISSVFEKVYLKWKSLIAETIVEQINDVPDLATVKVNPCQNGAKCKGFKICPYYHTPFDLRRNPLIYSYDLRMCLHQKSNYATCYKSEADCELSRNSYETKFHPSVYQVTRCPSSRTSEACNKIALCPNAHLDSPELFFTADWNDLIVIGADRTLEYFTGAIRSAKKVEHWYKLRIMLISISLGFLDFAISVSRKLLERYSLKACILGKDLTNPDSCEVLLGNPGAFLATNADDFKQAKGTIIIDDIERMLMNEKHLEQLTRFVRRVTSSSLNLTFNIVIVNFREDFWPNNFVNKLTKRFGLKYMEDPSATSGKSSVKQNYSAESIDKKADFSKGDKRCRSKSYDSVSRKRYRRSKSKTVLISSSNSDSKSYNLKGKKRIDSNSSKASRRSHSMLMTPPKRSSSESMSKLSMSMLVADTGSKSSSSDTIEVEIRNRLGNKLYEEYVEKIENLRMKFDQEFSIFKNVPELCPHYEYCFNNFDSLYSVQHKGKSKDHKEKLWELYWVAKLEEIKQNDFEVRRKNIVEEYYKKVSKDSSSSSFVQQSNVVLQNQKKAGHYDLTNQSSIRQSYRMDENKRESSESVPVSQSCIKQSNYIEENERTDSNYEFTEALSMLERLCDLVGFLGPSLSAMVATCRELGTNTKEAYSVFTSMENVMVISMILEKVKILRLSATRSKLFLLETALDWIPKLLEEAKNGPSTPKTDDYKLENLTIDIKALAKVSLGKSSEFALQLIETALAYEGVPNPSKELVNKLYLKVCEIHFRLSVDM